MLVVVVCQRKTGHVNETELVEDVIIPQIEAFVGAIVPHASIEYLSAMFENKGTVDYKIALGQDTDKSREFTDQNKGAYKAILLQTCTLVIMDKAVPYLYELLDDDGVLFITGFTKRGNIYRVPVGTSQNTWLQHLVDTDPVMIANDPMYGFIDNLNTYFIKVDSFTYKKKPLAQLGQRKKSKKSKRRRSKKRHQKKRHVKRRYSKK